MESIFMNISHLWEESLFCDGEIIAENKESYQVHRCILGAVSPFLKTKFTEESSLILQAPGVIVRELLKILYSQKIEYEDNEIIKEVKKLAEQLQIEFVTNICKDFFQKFSNYDKKLFALDDSMKIKIVDEKAFFQSDKKSLPLKRKRELEQSGCNCTQVGERVTRFKSGNLKPKFRKSDYLTDFENTNNETDKHDFEIEINKGDNNCSQESVQNTFKHILKELSGYDTKANDLLNKISDSTGFDRSVKQTFSEIVQKLEKPDYSNVPPDLYLDWIHCPYCSQFKGKKVGSFHFHIAFCDTNFKCEACFKPFVSELEIEEHNCPKIKQGMVCEICGKNLTGPEGHKLHMKMHAGIKDYECEYCFKRFTRKINLNSHLNNVHKKGNPAYYTCNYKCEYCSRGFIRALNLISHIQQEHQVDQDSQSVYYLCTICTTVFAEHEELLQHIQSGQCAPPAPADQGAIESKNLSIDTSSMAVDAAENIHISNAVIRNKTLANACENGASSIVADVTQNIYVSADAAENIHAPIATTQISDLDTDETQNCIYICGNCGKRFTDCNLSFVHFNLCSSAINTESETNKNETEMADIT